MTFLEAAYKILKENRKPMHYKEITRIAVDKSLIETEGSRPELTMHSMLSTDIKTKGAESLFKKLGSGIFGINSKINKNSKTLQLKLFKTEEIITPEKFSNLFIGKAGEYIVAGELLFRGFNADILPVDEGIDIIAKKENNIFNLQIKTANKSSYDRYNFNLRVSAFERNHSSSTFYVLVLQNKSNRDFIILPQRDIDKWRKERKINKIVEGKYYLISIHVQKGKYYLKGEDLSPYLNNWELITFSHSREYENVINQAKS